jgi:Family of unknown function (DUF6216)
MDSLSTFIQSAVFSRVVAVASLVFVGFFWLRAGSIQSVLERLWLLIAGGAEVHDPALKSFFQDNRDLERFRFVYRLKVERLDEVRKLVAWMEQHRVGMSRLQKMRHWVNANSDEIVMPPPKHYSRCRIAVAMAAIVAMVGVVQLASSPEAYFQMRGSKAWFKTDAVSVKAPMSNWSFDASDCSMDRSKIKQITGFLDKETNAVCNALQNGELKPLATRTIKLQQWAGVIGGLISFTVAILCMLAAFAAHEAAMLRKRIYGTDAKTATPEAESV